MSKSLYTTYIQLTKKSNRKFEISEESMNYISIDIIQTEDLRIKTDKTEPEKRIAWNTATNVGVPEDGKGRQKWKTFFLQ